MANLTFVLPEWIEAETWRAYESMRKMIKKPMNDDIRKLAVRRLERLRSQGNDPQEVLEQSTFNCWQGLFPIKRGSTPERIVASPELFGNEVQCSNCQLWFRKFALSKHSCKPIQGMPMKGIH